jgi:hypothetical protein
MRFVLPESVSDDIHTMHAIYKNRTHLEVAANDEKVNTIPATAFTSFLSRCIYRIQSTMALDTQLA